MSLAELARRDAEQQARWAAEDAAWDRHRAAREDARDLRLGETREQSRRANDDREE